MYKEEPEVSQAALRYQKGISVVIMAILVLVLIIVGVENF